MRRLDESWKLSTVGKMALAGMAAWVMGRATRLKLRGSPEEVAAVAAALLASRKFREEMMRPGATVEDVVAKLRLKNATADEFERVLGVKFPL